MQGGATATVTVSGGALAGGTVTAAGSGYQATPVVTVTPKDAGTGGSFTMTVGGQGGASEPSWRNYTNAYTIDGNIIWQCTGAAVGTEEVWKPNTAYTYVSIAGDVITLSGTHGWSTAQSIVYTASGTAAIGNLTSGTRYYVILTGTGTEVKLATSVANANAGTQIVLGAKSGTGTITLTPTYYVSGSASIVKNVAGTFKFTAVAGGLLSIAASSGSGYTVAPTITISKYPASDPYRFYKIADLTVGATTYNDTIPDIALITANSQLPTGMSNTILLGTNATGTGSSQFVVGDAANPVTDTYLGGVFNSTASTAGTAHTIHAMGGNGTDKAGGNLTIAGGQGTGAGAGGSVIFQTAPAAATASTANTLVTAMTINSPGFVGIGTTAPATLLQLKGGSARVGVVNYSQIDTTQITTPVLKLNTAQTTINGSTSGTIVWSQPEQGTAYKKVIIYLNALTDAGTTITYPTAFTVAPSVTNGSITGAAAATTLATSTTTVLTLTASTAVTGYIFIQGY